MSDARRAPRGDGAEASRREAPAARADEARPVDAAPVCEVCGAVMYDRHCKIVCPRCGYLRDCSDP